MDYTEEAPKNPKGGGDDPENGRSPLKANLRIIDTDIDSPAAPKLKKQEKTLRKKQLVNKLNLINFNKEKIQLNFKNEKDQRIIAFDVFPQICFGSYLLCLWQTAPDLEQIQKHYAMDSLCIKEDQAVITAHAPVRAINRKGVCLSLPEKSLQSSSRRVRRFSCDALNVHVIQNGIVFFGHLVDFSAYSFRVEIHSSATEAYQWLNLHHKINLLVFNGDGTLYSGECAILKKEGVSGKKFLVLKPLTDNIQRFSPKEYRSKRLELSPTPDILFQHPFTDNLVILKATDISGSGLCVEDDEENSVLIPGMIIPALTIRLANTFKFDCKAQVVYRRETTEESGFSRIQCGITFLDMNCDDHMRLLSLLHQAENKNLYICNEVDLDQLWRFFFEAGFIYPRKYKFIQENKEKIRATYDILYSTNSPISRYFTWQQKGVIQGHLSMLRFYENTWLIHHLAALPSSRLRVSVEILKQIGSFTYDSHRMFSSHMDYLICYFRPENRFSNHFFGGICNNIQDPKASSMDSFAYLHFRKNRKTDQELPEGWQLEKSTHQDLNELNSFYEHISGGLLPDALDLRPDAEMAERHNLANEYKKLNLKRQRKLYSLKHRHTLKAVLMANISNFAINLSDLTSSISVFVLDPEGLSPSILYQPIYQLSEKYELKTFPLLVFPLSYADAQSLPYERTYTLWALNMEHTDAYFKNFNQLS